MPRERAVPLIELLLVGQPHAECGLHLTKAGGISSGGASGGDEVRGGDIEALQLVGLEDQSHNQPVQTKRLSEDENQNDPDEQLGLAGVGADTSVTDDANGEPCCESRQAAAHASGESGEAGEGGVAVGFVRLDS